MGPVQSVIPTFPVLAAGAGRDDYLSLWDTRDATKDVYRVVSDGEGDNGVRTGPPHMVPEIAAKT